MSKHPHPASPGVLGGSCSCPNLRALRPAGGPSLPGFAPGTGEDGSSACSRAAPRPSRAGAPGDVGGFRPPVGLVLQGLARPFSSVRAELLGAVPRGGKLPQLKKRCRRRTPSSDRSPVPAARMLARVVFFFETRFP